MCYHSYLYQLRSVLFLPKDKCDLFLELEAGRPGRGGGNQPGDTDFSAAQRPKQWLMDSRLLKSLFRPATREKIDFKRSGESRNERSNVMICDQEGRENQVSLHPTRNTDCLIVIQWGTVSGRLIIIFKGKLDGCSYHKKWATKKRA